VLAIIILPILFYIPKFFEVRSHSIMWPHLEKIDCRTYVRFRLDSESTLFSSSQISTLFSDNRTIEDLSSSSQNLSVENLPLFYEECSKFNFRYKRYKNEEKKDTKTYLKIGRREERNKKFGNIRNIICRYFRNLSVVV
jgi:hypothetical protein